MNPFTHNAKKKDFQENLLPVMDSMYNLAYRLTYNREEARDLVQDASVRAFRFYHKFRKGTNFKAWILTILRNLFINKYRKRAKEPPKVNYEDLQNYISAPKMDGFAEEAFGESVQNAIDQMPEELRTIITLFYVDELSYKEIAEVMDCPLGTVMSRLYMARQMLKKSLENRKNVEA